MLSVIVPVYKNDILVAHCLTSLVANAPSDAEILVIDDASGMDTISTVRNFPSVRLISHKTNKGNTVAYNTGANKARGSILIFLDSDVLVPPGAIVELVHPLSTHSNVGAVGSLLLYPHDHRIQHAGVAFDKWILSHLFVGRSLESIEFEPLEERQAVTAAFFGCTREVFEEVGGFDETYRDGLEDIEFCLRCRELGYTNLITTETPSFHLESATRGPKKHIRRVYNYNIFFSRWHARFTADLNIYLTKGLHRLFSSWQPSDYGTLVVNFCTTPNWHDLVQLAVEMGGIDIIDMLDLSGGFAENEHIDLYRTLPPAIHNSQNSLLLVADGFLQLAKNSRWFEVRRAVDLVIDRHANALPTTALV